MKILLYTDNHFSQYSSIIRKRGNKYSMRLENQIQSLNWVEQIAQEEHVEKIVCLGDFFDKPELNAEELTALKEIKFSNIPHMFLVGNHEMGNGNIEFNSTNALSKYGQVIDKPTFDCGYGFEILYLPYILESERKHLNEYIEDTRNTFYKGMFTTNEVKNLIIFSHNDLAGIQLGQFKSKNGFDIEEITDLCSLYINGHLHNQSQINEKIFNIGNLTGQNFSEDATKYSHCIGILDTDTLKLQLIVNPYAFNFYKLEVTTLEELNKQISNINNNAIISLKIPFRLSERAKEQLLQNNKILEFRIVTIADIENNEQNIQELVSVDHIEQFKTYCVEHLGNSEALQEELSLLN